MTIVDLERLQVNAYVDEVDIGKIEDGQSATFTVDAFPARDFKGRVAAIYPTATIQDNVVKYIVAIDIDDEYAGLLRPEMTASVRIDLEISERCWPCRRARSGRRRGRSVVHVVADGGGTEVRPVRVGWRDGPWAEITEGLAEGDRILLDAPAAGMEAQPMSRSQRIARDVLVSLSAQRQRAFLMMLGLAVGVAVLSAVIVIGQGTRERIMGLVERHGLDMVMVRAGGEVQVFAPQADRGLASLVEADARAIEAELPYIDLVSAVQNQRGINVVYEDRSVVTRAFGVEPELAGDSPP